jgi:hypothetical protein
MAKRQYDFNVKTLGLFAVLVLATTAGVSLLYGSLYGFSFMGQQLTGAAQVMVAAANQPVAQGVYPMSPMGAGQGIHQMGGAAGQVLQQRQGAGQYVCPQHGAAGAPTFDANGVALCPIDGQPMQFYAANPAPIR